MKNLKELRIKAGISQAELSNKMGLTQPTISNWENGKGSPDAGQRKRLKTILGDNKEAQRNSQSSPLAAWLTKARLSKNWSIPELAHYSGLTAPALYRIEAGITRNLRDKTQKKLESALGSKLPEDTAEEIAQEAEIKGLGALEQFDPYVVAERPEEPGVYVFYDVSQRPIYVGESDNVKSRIKSHEEKFWFKRPIVESASWIRVSNKELRMQIEALLIKFLKNNAVINQQHVDR